MRILSTHQGNFYPENDKAVIDSSGMLKMSIDPLASTGAHAGRISSFARSANVNYREGLI
ncbi:MAG: hypothetical protein ACYS8Z_12260 [Planctomycetota bacterium]